MSRLDFEIKLWDQGFKRIMGLDEVGRGCLAGPVVAAGVIFERGTTLIDGIRDSKKIPEKERRQLSKVIKEKALYWTVKEGSISKIDKLNILWASLDTMKECAENELASPDYLLVDGNRYITSIFPHTCLIKGDDRSMSIGAASILAKVYRDDLMAKYAKTYPEFGWESNVGYPTPKHKQALAKYGKTEHHRTTFKLGTEKVYKKS